MMAYSADRFSEASLLDFIFWGVGWGGVLVSKGWIIMKPVCNNMHAMKKNDLKTVKPAAIVKTKV